jgi:hypothetical protein
MTYNAYHYRTANNGADIRACARRAVGILPRRTALSPAGSITTTRQHATRHSGLHYLMERVFKCVISSSLHFVETQAELLLA